MKNVCWKFLLPVGLAMAVNIPQTALAMEAANQINSNSIVVTGVVTDSHNQPLPGVTVYEKGTKKGTITNAGGHYSITVNEKATLVFSYIGYEVQEINTGGKTVINAALKASNSTLNEVVAIGYQKIRKSDVTGAISSVKKSELNLTAPTVSQALVGKVAGVQVSQNSGAPYAGTKIRVRGIGSLTAGSDPLYVIDGYPAGNNVFINPEDIETIDILKDAASAAIYGSRAAGGVVMITTKRGQDGKGRLEYDVQTGFSQLEKKVKLLDANQFIDLVINARNNSYKDLVVNSGKTWNDAMYSDDNTTRVAKVGNGSSVSIPEDIYDFANQKRIDAKYNTDWQDVLYRNAPFQRHNLSFSGGAKDVRYYVSGGYQNQDGIVANTGMQTINFRSNIDANVSKRLKIVGNAAYTQTTSNEVGEGRFSPMMAALLYIPYLPAFDDQGQYIKYGMNALGNQFGFQGIENPLASVKETKSKRLGYRGTMNASATYEILDGLSFKTNVGTQFYNEKYDYYLPTSLSNGAGNPPYSASSIAAANAVAQTLTQVDRLAEFTLNYDKKFGKHNLNLLGGYSAQETTSDQIRLVAKGFTSDMIGEITDKGADPSLFTLDNSKTGKSSTTLLSYFGRASYNYAGKYFLSGSLRRDGSSRFGPLNKWGTFPSIAAGWNISQEDWYNDFLGRQSIVKLRMSWGLSGNNNIGNYNATQVVNSPTGAVFGANTIASAVLVGGVKDQKLGWESTSQYNVGADITVFDNRLSVIANYYLSRSFNLLYNQPISAVSGSSSILTNLRDSKVQNKGFDLQLDGQIIRKKDLTVGLGGNISVNRNKVLDLGQASTIITSGAERSYNTHITTAGQPIGMFYGYKVAGRVTEENINKVAPSASSSNPLKPGDLYFEDVHQDGVINDLDKTVIGSPYAKFTYGFALSVTYKSFDFRTSFNGSYGNQILDGQDYYLYNFEGSGNQYVQVADRYVSASQPGNGLNYRASRAGTQSNSTRLSSFYLQDGSYLRMTNATVGYNLPKLFGKHVENIRVYGSVDNVFTWTKYKGYNPDVDYNIGSNLSPGVDYGNYPLARTFNLGAKITF